MRGSGSIGGQLNKSVYINSSQTSKLGVIGGRDTVVEESNKSNLDPGQRSAICRLITLKLNRLAKTGIIVDRVSDAMAGAGITCYAITCTGELIPSLISLNSRITHLRIIATEEAFTKSPQNCTDAIPERLIPLSQLNVYKEVRNSLGANMDLSTYKHNVYHAIVKTRDVADINSTIIIESSQSRTVLQFEDEDKAAYFYKALLICKLAVELLRTSTHTPSTPAPPIKTPTPIPNYYDWVNTIYITPFRYSKEVVCVDVDGVEGEPVGRTVHKTETSDVISGETSISGENSRTYEEDTRPEPRPIYLPPSPNNRYDGRYNDGYISYPYNGHMLLTKTMDMDMRSCIDHTINTNINQEDGSLSQDNLVYPSIFDDIG